MNSYFITVDKLVTTSYNCRGAMANGIYIQELMESSDILCVQEHLLHNENVTFLTSLNNEYRCFARCDSYINEHGYTIRKGDVAIMWKVTIHCAVTKLENIGNSRIVGIKLSLRDMKPLYIINVYLPSANNSYDDYYTCVSDLWEIYESLKDTGTIIITGDLNSSINKGQRTYISPGHDTRRINLLSMFIEMNNMYSVITQHDCYGPICTYYPNSPWAKSRYLTCQYHQRGPHFNGTNLFRYIYSTYFFLLDIPNW